MLLLRLTYGIYAVAIPFFYTLGLIPELVAVYSIMYFFSPLQIYFDGKEDEDEEHAATCTTQNTAIPAVP